MWFAAQCGFQFEMGPCPLESKLKLLLFAVALWEQEVFWSFSFHKLDT